MPTTDPQTKPAGRGCLFYGCLSAVVLVLVLLLTAYLTIRYVVNTAIENYTDSTPQQFEQVAISAGEREDLMNRVAEFNDAKGKTNQPVLLTLTGPEINTLITEDPAQGNISNNVRVNIEGDELKARATIPLEPFSSMPFLSQLKGRHLNISLRVGVSLENGNAKISVGAAEVNGKPLPKEILDALKQEASFQKALDSPEIREKLNQLDWIKIEDGQIQIGVGGSKEPSQ